MKNYNDSKVKDEILANEEDINDGANNVKDIEPLLTPEFIDDLNKAVDLASKDPEQSPKVDKILSNEMNLITKIKDNLPLKSDQKK